MTYKYYRSIINIIRNKVHLKTYELSISLMGDFIEEIREIITIRGEVLSAEVRKTL